MPTQPPIRQATAFLPERVKRQAREADRLPIPRAKATDVCEATNPLPPHSRMAFAGTNLLLTFATNVTNMASLRISEELSAQKWFGLLYCPE